MSANLVGTCRCWGDKFVGFISWCSELCLLWASEVKRSKYLYIQKPEFHKFHTIICLRNLFIMSWGVDIWLYYVYITCTQRDKEHSKMDWIFCMMEGGAQFTFDSSKSSKKKKRRSHLVKIPSSYHFHWSQSDLTSIIRSLFLINHTIWKELHKVGHNSPQRYYLEVGVQHARGTRNDALKCLNRLVWIPRT